MKRKAEITLEFVETIVVRQRNESFQAFCPFCRRTVEMSIPSSAASSAGLTEREIFRRIERGEAHFIEAPTLFVCKDSLTGLKDPRSKDLLR
ncbi:MAG: hypothetical protein J5I65_18370 [Aridibacter famidurans]|nr:hypothetical protein [Aridibacter famidurans]